MHYRSASLRTPAFLFFLIPMVYIIFYTQTMLMNHLGGFELILQALPLIGWFSTRFNWLRALPGSINLKTSKGIHWRKFLKKVFTIMRFCLHVYFIYLHIYHVLLYFSLSFTKWYLLTYRLFRIKIKKVCIIVFYWFNTSSKRLHVELQSIFSEPCNSSSELFKFFSGITSNFFSFFKNQISWNRSNTGFDTFDLVF